MSYRFPLRILAAALALTACAELSAQDWPHWRGPNLDGSTDVADLPLEFDREKNVLWKARLPGPGAATPIIYEDYVFISSIDTEKDGASALCLDRHSGEVLWQRPVSFTYQPDGAPSKTQLHHRSNYASPSPTTDGKRVVFFYGVGEMIAFDLEGNELWSRNLQNDYGAFAFQWTFSASPTIWEGRLFLAVLQRDEPANGRGKPGSPSFLLALDVETGETLYRHERPSDAIKESLESYATMIPYVGAGGRKEVLVIGGDVITGHDPESGKELWRWGTWNPGHREAWWRVVPSPVIGDGVVLVCAPKRAPVYAIRLDGSGKLDTQALAWQSEGKRNPVSSDVPTPLYYEGRFYVLSDVRGALSRVDPKSGEVEWSIDMPGRSLWRASPTGAAGRIFCMNHAGLVVAVDAASGKIVTEARMGDEDDDLIRSTVSVAHDNLFIRTNDTLFCIGS